MAEKEIRKAELGDEELNEAAGGIILGTTAINNQKDGIFKVEKQSEKTISLPTHRQTKKQKPDLTLRVKR